MISANEEIFEKCFHEGSWIPRCLTLSTIYRGLFLEGGEIFQSIMIFYINSYAREDSPLLKTIPPEASTPLHS